MADSLDQASFGDRLRELQDALPTLRDLGVAAGQVEQPLVVLVHGIGGSAQHWSNPIGLSLDQTWLYDIDADPQPTDDASPLLCSPPYQPGAVKDWCSALSDAGLTSINFSQSEPCGPLAIAVDELIQLLRTVEALVYGGGAPPPPYVLLCHSRGGLAARQALKQLGRAGLPHLARVITLSTPHGGSFVPALARDYDAGLAGSLDFTSLGSGLGPISGLLGNPLSEAATALAGQVRGALLHTFGAAPDGVGFDELLPGSDMLRDLAAGEAALEGVSYHGFGGSSPGVVSLYLTVAGKLLRVLTVSSPSLVELIDRCAPALLSDFGGLAELDQGDSAVSVASSQWPDAFGASHQLFAINHMQALIDPSLKSAVTALIGQ